MALVGDVLRRAIRIGSKAGNLGAAKSIIRFGSAASTIPGFCRLDTPEPRRLALWVASKRCRARHGG